MGSSISSCGDEKSPSIRKKKSSSNIRSKMSLQSEISPVYQDNGTASLVKSSNWQSKLRSLISEVDEQVVHWSSFKQALLKFMQNASFSSKDSLSIKSNLESGRGYKPRHTSQFNSIVLSDHAKSTQLDQNDHKFGTSPNNDITMAITSEPSPPKTQSNKSIERVLSEAHSEISRSSNGTVSTHGRNEFRDTIEYLINQDDFIIKPLITRFHMKFEVKFTKDLAALDSGKLQGNHVKIYEDVCILIQSFMKVVKDFMKWMNEDLMKKIEPILENGAKEADWVMESIIYKFLFNQPKSVLNRFTFRLFKKKYVSTIGHLREHLREQRAEEIMNNQEFLEQNPLFLLKDIQIPYEVIVSQIADLRNKTNSYNKFEVVIALNNEIFRCAERYFEGNPSTTAGLKNKFMIEVQILVLTNCILKNYNPELLINKTFISGLVSENQVLPENFGSLLTVISRLLIDDRS